MTEPENDTERTHPEHRAATYWHHHAEEWHRHVEDWKGYLARAYEALRHGDHR
jgi:hypothetical protein